MEIENGASIAHREKCIKLHALTVDRKRRFRSNQMVADLYIARNAFESIDREDTDRE